MPHPEAYPEAYIDFLVHFHGDRDWFECHERLEEYWKEHPDDPKSDTWVGLIQVAVSLYHHRRGNIAGARKMSAGVLDHLRGEHLTALGIDASSFLKAWEDRHKRLVSEPNPAFSDFDIPIADPLLEQRCRRLCEEKGLRWRAPSDMSNADLVHKHLRRDRTDVIETRRRAAEQKAEQQIMTNERGAKQNGASNH